MEGPAGLLFSHKDEKAGTTDMAAATMVKGGGPVPELASLQNPSPREAIADYYGAYDKAGCVLCYRWVYERKGSKKLVFR